MKIHNSGDILLSIENVKFVFRKIRCGEFIMGASDFRSDTFPPHPVRLTSDYWMGETLVTQRQWSLFNMNSMEDMMEDSAFDTLYGVGDSFPTYFLTWYEAKQYCSLFSSVLEKYGYEASLPSEAEWEYAARGGSYMPYFFGDKCDGTQVNCDGRKPYGQRGSGIFRGEATPVALFQPNAYGLYDIHGNLWEWCEDWYDNNYYAVSPSENPTGPCCGERKVIRGGGWNSPAECCRTAFRDSDQPSYRGRTLGFRIRLRIRQEQ